MITVNGRLVAAIVLIISGAAIAAIGVAGAAGNNLTSREAIAGGVVLVVAAIAGAWLRRDSRRRS